jgi:hypothetical protein
MTIRELFDRDGGGFQTRGGGRARMRRKRQHRDRRRRRNPRPNNVVALRLRGYVVHLTAAPDELWRRIVRTNPRSTRAPNLSATPNPDRRA